jgi:hypothetical protein
MDVVRGLTQSWRFFLWSLLHRYIREDHLELLDAADVRPLECCRGAKHPDVTPLGRQALFSAGAYHPSVAADLSDALSQNYTPAQYPTPRLRQLGYKCGCLDFYTDPCRMEFRKVSLTRYYIINRNARTGLGAGVSMA